MTGHAYPWDVIGDADFAPRVRDLGVGRVALAASYHSVRAATPLHPHHQVVEARHAALYRPIRPEIWRGRRLLPGSPSWSDEPDPFGAALRTLRAAGLAVRAWIVLTHDTRLGTAHPDVAVVNCFGEPYPYALCPARQEVRDHVALLAAEAVHDTDVDAVGLEAAGQLGLVHSGHHDKTDGAWTPAAVRLLSICCCTACRSAWAATGAPSEEIVSLLRAEVLAEAVGGAVGGEAPGGRLDAWLPLILATRQGAADRLRAQIVDAVRGAAGAVHVTLHAHPDPWSTGPSVGLTPAVAAAVDALLVPCWPTVDGTAALVAAARTASGLPTGAYVTVLPPAEPERLAGHARRLLAAGAAELAVYHLGLAPTWRQRHITELAAIEAASRTEG